VIETQASRPYNNLLERKMHFTIQDPSSLTRTSCEESTELQRSVSLDKTKIHIGADVDSHLSFVNNHPQTPPHFPLYSQSYPSSPTVFTPRGTKPLCTNYYYFFKKKKKGF
jgi:hypothetical protein